jgi:hypothetical protein
MKARASLYVNPNLEIIPSRLARVIGAGARRFVRHRLEFRFLPIADNYKRGNY